MKGAILLAKSDDLFKPLVRHLQSLGHSYVGGDEGSIVLDPNCEYRFTLYDRSDRPSILEECEIPEQALRLGYRFAYMIECRSEGLFCEVVSRIPAELDILILDNNGDLLKPDELDPTTICL